MADISNCYITFTHSACSWMERRIQTGFLFNISSSLVCGTLNYYYTGGYCDRINLLSAQVYTYITKYSHMKSCFNIFYVFISRDSRISKMTYFLYLRTQSGKSCRSNPVTVLNSAPAQSNPAIHYSFLHPRKVTPQYSTQFCTRAK